MTKTAPRPLYFSNSAGRLRHGLPLLLLFLVQHLLVPTQFSFSAVHHIFVQDLSIRLGNGATVAPELLSTLDSFPLRLHSVERSLPGVTGSTHFHEQEIVPMWSKLVLFLTALSLF